MLGLLLAYVLSADADLAVRAFAADGPNERAIARDMAAIKSGLPDALRGDRKAIEALLRLAGRPYVATAEGDEWLNEIYLDLRIGHPRVFLATVAAADEDTRRKVVKELMSPVTDKYSHGDLLAGVKTAEAAGLRAPFLTRLLGAYGEAK